MNTPIPTPSNERPGEANEAAREASLVARARAGDEDAFGELVGMHATRLYHVMYRMAGNADDARELAQQAWVKAWQRLGSFKGESRFFTWLYRLASNTALDFLRRRARQREVEFSEVTEAAGEAESPAIPVATEQGPDREVAAGEMRRAFFAALEKLSPEHRMALILREVEGRSYQEIAQTMKCRIGTVMSRIFYARKAMQDVMRDYR